MGGCKQDAGELAKLTRGSVLGHGTSALMFSGLRTAFALELACASELNSGAPAANIC